MTALEDAVSVNVWSPSAQIEGMNMAWNKSVPLDYEVWLNSCGVMSGRCVVISTGPRASWLQPPTSISGNCPTECLKAVAGKTMVRVSGSTLSNVSRSEKVWQFFQSVLATRYEPLYGAGGTGLSKSLAATCVTPHIRPLSASTEGWNCGGSGCGTVPKRHSGAS